MAEIWFYWCRDALNERVHRAIIHNDQTRGLNLKFLWIFWNFTEFCQFSANFRVGNAILIDLRRPFKARNQVQKELEYRTSNGKAKICFCGWYTHWNDTSYQNCFKDYQLENVIYMIGQIERLFLGQIEFTQRTTSLTFARQKITKISQTYSLKVLYIHVHTYQIEITFDKWCKEYSRIHILEMISCWENS